MPHILVASDTASVRKDIVAAIAGPDVDLLEVATGPQVIAAVNEDDFDLVICDMQMGSMGAVAVTLELRLEESYDRIDPVPVLIVLDRRPDVFLAKRSGAEGWLVKPLDPIRLRRSVAALLAGETYHDESFQPVPVLSSSAS